MKQLWMIEGSPMRVFKWTPDFDSRVESSVTPVWIGLPELPLHLFHKKALFEITSLIGKPLKVDKPTADQTRPSIARVCVELDLLKDRVEEIALVCGDVIPFLFERRCEAADPYLFKQRWFTLFLIFLWLFIPCRIE